MQEQNQEQEINVDNIQREFTEICGSFQKLMNSVNYVANNLTEGVKKVGAITAGIENLGPRVDTLNNYAHGVAQERMILKQRIAQLETIIDKLNNAALEKLETDDEDKIVSVIEDEI